MTSADQATCTPTAIPTITFTAMPTLTPTATATATDTPTPTATLPSCGTAVASRECAHWERCDLAPNYCTWEPGPLSTPELSCDPNGPYRLFVDATECEMFPPYGIQSVCVSYQKQDTTWTDCFSMQVTPGPPRHWAITLCPDPNPPYKPSHFKFRWLTWPGQSSNGLKSLKVEYCCGGCP